MTYLSVRELAAKFDMPERTVYYHTANNSSIRRKKKGRKRIFNVADFAATCEIGLQQLPQNHSPTPPEASDSKSSQQLQLLQKQNEEQAEEIHTLRTMKTDLETVRNKFIKLYSEEKDEKKVMQEKYEQLQKVYYDDTKKYMTRLHVAIGVATVLFAVLLVLNRSTLIVG